MVVVITAVSPRRAYSCPSAAIRLLFPPPPMIAVVTVSCRARDVISKHSRILIPPFRFLPISYSKNNTQPLKSQSESVIIKLSHKIKEALA